MLAPFSSPSPFYAPSSIQFSVFHLHSHHLSFVFTRWFPFELFFGKGVHFLADLCGVAGGDVFFLGGSAVKPPCYCSDCFFPTPPFPCHDDFRDRCPLFGERGGLVVQFGLAGLCLCFCTHTAVVQVLRGIASRSPPPPPQIFCSCL